MFMKTDTYSVISTKRIRYTLAAWSLWPPSKELIISGRPSLYGCRESWLHPRPLLLAFIGKVYTCHTTRRKNKIVEMKVVMWGGGGDGAISKPQQKRNRNHTYVHTLCYVFTVKHFKIYSLCTWELYYVPFCRFLPTTLYLHRLMTRSACPPGLAGSRL